MIALFIDDQLTTEMAKFPSMLESYTKFDEVYSWGNVEHLKGWLEQYPLEADVAIIDHFLGDVKGSELGGWINKTYPHIICILLTGGASKKREKDIRDFTPEELLKDRLTLVDGLLEVSTQSLEAGFCSFLLKSNVVHDEIKLHRELDRVLDLPSSQAKIKIRQELINAHLRFSRVIQEFNETKIQLPYIPKRRETKLRSILQSQEIVLQFLEKEDIHLNGDVLGFLIYLVERNKVLGRDISVETLKSLQKSPWKVIDIAKQHKIKLTEKVDRHFFRTSIQGMLKFYNADGCLTDAGHEAYYLLKQNPNNWPVSRMKSLQRLPNSSEMKTFIDKLVDNFFRK